MQPPDKFKENVGVSSKGPPSGSGEQVQYKTYIEVEH